MHGVLLPLTAATMATNASPVDLSAWLTDMFLPPGTTDWPLNVAVVRSGGKTILIDSGLRTEFPDFPRAGQLAMRLDAAGIDAASVTDVVLTHLHMDHIGGLLVDGLRGRLRQDLRATSRFLDVYRGQLQTFETEYEVAPGSSLVARTRSAAADSGGMAAADRAAAGSQTADSHTSADQNRPRVDLSAARTVTVGGVGQGARVLSGVASRARHVLANVAPDPSPGHSWGWSWRLSSLSRLGSCSRVWRIAG